MRAIALCIGVALILSVSCAHNHPDPCPTPLSTSLPSFCNKLPLPDTNNQWYEINNSNTAFVFVHGIFGDSRETWLYLDENKITDSKYWPDLVYGDERFEKPSIFLGGYSTAFDSGNYDDTQASKELFEALTTPDRFGNKVMDKKNLLFVCHSTGGIVTRHMILRHADDFKDKVIGLVLMASPSHGSKWADKLALLANVYNNRLGTQLQWRNGTLEELDDDFLDLVRDRRIPSLVGAEAIENHFIIHYKWLPFWTTTLLVPKESAGGYFGSARVLPQTDHFSIVKPISDGHTSHNYLAWFFSNRFRKAVLTSDPHVPPRALTKQEQSVAILSTAKMLREEFKALRGSKETYTKYDFSSVNDLIKSLLEIDSYNGFAHYYAGEVWRMLNRREDSHREFYYYLEQERTLHDSEKLGDTGIEICYQRATGYCRQRTGWIHHLFANDFYEQGLTEKENDKKIFRLKLALEHAQNALNYYPVGFEQFIPTKLLIERLEGLLDAAKTK